MPEKALENTCAMVHYEREDTSFVEVTWKKRVKTIIQWDLT